MRRIRVVALMEAYTVTGPARNLIRFCRGAALAQPPDDAAEVSIATFYRARRGEAAGDPSNQFIAAAREAAIGVDVVRERYRFDRAVIGQLASVFERRAPDVIQTHGIKAHFLMRFASLRRGYRWVAFHHGYTAEDLKMRVYNQLNRWSLPAADRVITVCTPFAEALVRAGVPRDRIRVLPNAIEPGRRAGEDEIREVRRKLGIASGERVLLSIGRFSTEKAQVDLIPAMRRLAALYGGPFRLLLVGDGPERGRVEGAAAEAGWKDRVLFTGHQQHVEPYYGIADLFVLPSHSEGSPNVLLEAMAAGVPVVATAVGGVPETIEDGKSGLLVPCGDAGAMAAALHRLLSNPEYAARLAENAAARIAQRHSPDAYRRALLSIYAELVAQ